MTCSKVIEEVDLVTGVEVETEEVTGAVAEAVVTEEVVVAVEIEEAVVAVEEDRR